MSTTITKSRPIIFSGPMIRAILSGTKTQTRRIVKPQPTADYVTFMPLSTELVGITKHGGEVDRRGWVTCPYGAPGDQLWVKETWQSGEYAMNEPRGPVYRATDPDWETMDGWAWKPSIFMPRWASRITLEIESVRVERLQDISVADCIHEGAPIYEDSQPRERHDVREWYSELWDEINGKGAWAANPFVWVVSFRHLTGEGK